MDFVVPIFNFRVHKFDEEVKRKARRFERSEIEEKYEPPKESFQGAPDAL